MASGVSSLLGLGIPLLVFLVTTPFLIRQLGAAKYGLFTIFLSMTSLLGSLDFGLGAGGVRAAGRALAGGDRQKAARLLRELATLFLAVGLVVLAIMILVAPQLVNLFSMTDAVSRDEAEELVKIAGVLALFAFATASVSILPRALEQFPSIAVIQVLSNIGLWGGAVVLLIYGGSLRGLLIWAAVLSGIIFFVYAAWNTRLLPDLRWAPVFRFDEFKAVWGYSLYAFFGQVSSAFTYHADKLLIAYFLGPAPVAYYAVAVNLASKVLTLGATVTAFAFPRAVSLHAAGDGEALCAFYLRASRYTMLLLVPLLAPGVALAAPLLTLWLGKEFAAQSAVLFQILLVAYFLAALSVVPSHVYNGMGNARIGATYALTGTFINVLMCGVLIPSFGVLGAAIASLFGMIQAVFYMGSLEQTLGLGWFRSQQALYLQLLLLMGAQGAFLYLAGFGVAGWLTLILVGAAGWGLFYALWWLLGFTSSSDIAMIQRVAGKWLK